MGTNPELGGGQAETAPLLYGPFYFGNLLAHFFSLSILNFASNGASRIILSLFVWLQYFFENDG